MFKLTIIAYEFPKGFRMLFGNAVEVSEASADPVQSRVLFAGEKRLLFVEGVVSNDELKEIHEKIAKQSIEIADWEIGIGKTIKRDEVIFGPHNFNDVNGGSSLHPDMHFTYRLEEWWAGDNKTFRALWETRNFLEIGNSIKNETGLALHNVGDRVGNFLIFRKLSQWILDSSPNFDKTSRWVRPLHFGDATPSIDLLLSYRILSGQESVEEGICPIDQKGIEIPIHRTYDKISLFNRTSGDLLACDTSDLFTGLQIRTSFSKSAPIKPVGTDKMPRDIKWNIPDGASRSTLGSKEPWMGGAQLRRHTNRLLQEHYRVRLFKRGERNDVLNAIRNIVKDHTREFLYIWDPYFDANDVKDFLPELHPSIRCKILCGSPHKPKEIKKKTYPIQNELDDLRKSPWDKDIECKFRYRKAKKRILTYYHDRFLITRNAAWVLGSSLNSIGKKDGCLIRLLDPDRLRWMFEDEWDQKPSSQTFYEEII